MLIRLLATSQMAAIRWWVNQIRHPSQYATKGGIILAASKLGILTEATLHRTRPMWAVTVDFQKLYKTIDPILAGQVGVLLGLSQESMDHILLPLTIARGAWRVPHNSPVPLRRPKRGMPQGLASSVVMAELFLSLVLWKISPLAAACPNVMSCPVDSAAVCLRFLCCDLS